MESSEIFNAALEVIALVKTKTDHFPTAMRILSCAKQGFNCDQDQQQTTPCFEHR